MLLSQQRSSVVAVVTGETRHDIRMRDEAQQESETSSWTEKMEE